MPPYEDFPATECDYLDLPNYVACYSQYLSMGISDIASITEIKESSQEMTILKAELEGMTKEKNKIANEFELLKKDHQITIQSASIATLEKEQMEQKVIRRDETIIVLQKENGSLKSKLKFMTNRKKKAEETNRILKGELAYIPTWIIGEEENQNTRDNTNEDFSELCTNVDTMTEN